MGYHVATGPAARRPNTARGEARAGPPDATGAYGDRMGVIGELFPGKKLTHEGSEDSDGQTHTPRFDIDLDTGVARLPRTDRTSAEDHTDGPETA